MLWNAEIIEPVLNERQLSKIRFVLALKKKIKTRQVEDPKRLMQALPHCCYIMCCQLACCQLFREGQRGFHSGSLP